MSNSLTCRHLVDSGAAFSKAWATLQEEIWRVVQPNITLAIMFLKF